MGLANLLGGLYRYLNLPTHREPMYGTCDDKFKANATGGKVTNMLRQLACNFDQ